MPEIIIGLLIVALLVVHFIARPIVMGWERMRNMTTSEQEG